MFNERFANALQGKPQAVPPIWLMRQAGRYHAHYQALKANHTFMELCKDPDLAAQAALGPVEDFDFDLAILFSDLLFPLEAMGMGLEYGGSGPELGWRLQADNLSRLKPAGEAAPFLEFQRTAVAKTRALLPGDKSLIGFVGGPWTLFRYAVNGTHQPQEELPSLDLWHGFADHITPLLETNIALQFEGGAEVVMVLDTSAGQLAPEVYHREVTPYVQRLADAFPKKLGYYSKAATPSHFDHGLFRSGNLGGVGVDSGWDMPRALATFQSNGFVQGNFNEETFLLPPPEFRVELTRYLERMRELGPEGRRGWVCGAGHGIRPKTPEENVRTFVAMTREMLT